MKKILIMKPDQDEVAEAITLDERQRAFIIVDEAVYLVDTGTERLFFYPTLEHREKQLCKAHQDILNEHIK